MIILLFFTRPSPRLRSPPRESRQSSSHHQSDSRHRNASPYRPSSETNREEATTESRRAASEPRSQDPSHQAAVASNPPREEWIPGLDVPPTQATSNLEAEKRQPTYETSHRRDEDFR